MDVVARERLAAAEEGELDQEHAAGDPRTAFDASGRTPTEQSVWSHVQRLLQLRAQRSDLRTGRLEHLYVSDQAFAYRRGRTVVALNNDTAAVTVKLPVTTLPDDALGVCARPRSENGTVAIVIPRRSGCVF